MWNFLTGIIVEDMDQIIVSTEEQRICNEESQIVNDLWHIE